MSDPTCGKLIPGRLFCKLAPEHNGDCNDGNDTVWALLRRTPAGAAKLDATLDWAARTIDKAKCSDGRSNNCDYCAQPWIVFRGLSHVCVTCGQPVSLQLLADPCCPLVLGPGGDA